MVKWYFVSIEIPNNIMICAWSRVEKNNLKLSQSLTYRNVSLSQQSIAALPNQHRCDSSAIQMNLFDIHLLWEMGCSFLLGSKSRAHLQLSFGMCLVQQSKSPQPKLINHRFALPPEKPSKTQKSIQNQLIPSPNSINLSNNPFRKEIAEDPIHPRFTLET